MAEGITTLTYAVRPRVLGKYLGQLGLMLALLSLPPALAAWAFGDDGIALRYALLIVLILACAVPASRLSAPDPVQTNEALAVVALAFVLSPLLMALPLTDTVLGFGDALFELVSGVTTTGLTTLAGVEDKPPSFLFIRAWCQWFGGLGFVVLSVALLMGHDIAARRLAEPVAGETLVTTAHTHARRMVAVYALLTLFGLAGAWLLLGDGFLALTHVLAAVSTGGFSSLDQSLAGLPDWGGRFFILSLCLLGALPLPLYYRTYVRGWREAVRDVELRALLIAVTLLSALLALSLHYFDGIPWAETATHGLALGISAQTTTGFSTLDVGHLDTVSKAMLIAAMAAGGGVGSTAGGIKLLRILILLRLVQLTLQRTAITGHAVLEPRLGGRTLEEGDLIRALLLFLLFIGTVLLSWLVFLAYGYPPLDALFEVVSATGTVGLSTGITSSALPPLLKGVLCADMLLGRLEFLALLVLLYPRTWFGRHGGT